MNNRTLANTPKVGLQAYESIFGYVFQVKVCVIFKRLVYLQPISRVNHKIMKVLGNLLWWLFGGLEAAIGYFTGSLAMAIFVRRLTHF